MIVAASIIAGRALAPVDQVIGQWRAIGRAREAHRRCVQAFARASSATPHLRLPAPTGALRISGLTKFAPGQTGGDRQRILDRVSFALVPGDGLGVIGNSASGKSTLARLLVGAWTADAGEIRLDGATHAQWAPEDLGRHIGYLPQVVEMLPGSIRDNIARFDPQAPDAAVIAAARMAGVHEMILALPDGYATDLGQAGCRSRAARSSAWGWPARCTATRGSSCWTNPIPTSTRRATTRWPRAIAAMRARGSTVIVMAHRPSAIAAVSKVMILHNGAVAQFGLKEEVMQPTGRMPVAAAAADGTGTAPAADARPRAAETVRLRSGVRS